MIELFKCEKHGHGFTPGRGCPMCSGTLPKPEAPATFGFAFQNICIICERPIKNIYPELCQLCRRRFAGELVAAK